MGVQLLLCMLIFVAAAAVAPRVGVGVARRRFALALRAAAPDGSARFFRRRREFQRFLIALSVRPGSKRAILDQLFPSRAWASSSACSSSAVHGVFLIDGSR